MLVKYQKWLILIAVTLGLSMDLLDMTVVNVAIPKIMMDFGANIHSAQYIVTAYMVTIGLFEPITAYWADTHGMKKLYLISLVVFTIGSISSALAWSIESLISFRILQAIGGGMIMPLALSIVKNTFDKKELPLAMGMMGIPLLLAPSIGPTVGGYLVEYQNWRGIFWLNLPLGLLAIYFSYILLNEFPTVKKKLDLWGFILSGTGFATLFLAITNGPTDGWSSFKIVSLLLVAGISLSLFLIVETQNPEPLLNLNIFRNRIYVASIFTTFFFMIALFGSLFLIPLFMQELRALGPVETGMLLIPEFIGAVIFIPVSAVVLPRVGASVLTVIGILLMSLGSYPLIHIQVLTELHVVERDLFIIGCGLGLGIMPSITLAYGSLPEPLVNQGSAFLNLARQLGSALGVSVLTSVIQQYTPVYLQNLLDKATPWSDTTLILQQLTAHFQSIGYTWAQSRQLSVNEVVSLFQQQASVTAFQDAFGISTMLGLLGIISALFLHQRKSRKTTDNDTL
ncbi:multidrug resistance protein Stp [Peptococcaceae bacterium CEB3]|nr:multidrug resistance protein Stp [Peptococcaceae bacterium CEB3]